MLKRVQHDNYFCTELPLRTCRAMRGPVGVRCVQLTAANHLKFEKSAYCRLYPVLGEVLTVLQARETPETADAMWRLLPATKLKNLLFFNSVRKKQ